MAMSLDDVLNTMVPAQRARVKARAQKLIEEEATHRDPHQVRHLTQELVAEVQRRPPRRRRVK